MPLNVIPIGLTHWLVDALGGTKMETPRRGKFDGATYAVSGGQVTITQADGGGKVRHIRGVWLNTVDFSWDGYWAKPLVGSPTNYYSSAVNNATTTVITLASPPADGTSIQVFYYCESTQALVQSDLFDGYPCWYKCYEGPYPLEVGTLTSRGKFSAAVDAEQWFAIACDDAFTWTGDLRWKRYADTIMRVLREFDSGIGIPSSTMDDFERSLVDRGAPGLYSGNGTSDALDYFDIVVDPYDTSNRALKMTATISASGYAYCGRGLTLDMSASPDFEFRFMGESKNRRYVLKLCNDPSKTETIDTIYKYAFADDASGWVSFSVPTTSIRRFKNLAYSGGIQPTTFWTCNDTGSTISASEVYKKLTESTFTHYFAQEITWNLGSGTYAGAGVDMPSGVVSTGETNVNFFVTATVSTNVRVKWRDALDVDYYSDITIPVGSSRQTVTLSGTHPMKKVSFEFSTGISSPTSGTIHISDIKFGAAQTLPAGDVSFYQFDFPQNGTYTALFDDVGIEASMADDYPGLPYFTYQWTEANKVPWRGPTYTGYCSPAAYYKAGHTDIASSMATFFADAQNEYATLYSVSAGPFMPTHMRGLQENREYDTLNAFSWEGPDTNTTWAGFQYRALAQLAHYYYLSGDTTAKTALDNWMTWLSARLFEDPAYPSTPKGYKTPVTFANGSQMDAGSAVLVEMPSLLLHCDGTNNGTDFVDSSPYSHTITANGNAKTSTTQKVFGAASAYFDGSGDYLSIPDNGAFNLGSGAFTITLRVRPSSHADTGCLFGQYVNNDNRVIIYTSVTTGYVKFLMRSGGSNVVFIDSMTSLPVNTWSTVTVVRYGNSWRLYLNGSVVNSVTYSGSYVDYAAPVTIGMEGAGVQRPFHGYIDEVLVVKGTALYTANHTPPAVPFVAPFTSEYFSPDFHALIAQAMIFKYWRDGDSAAYTWYRRLLDDLITNRKDASGCYKAGSYTYGFHQGEVGKALGMLINGRPGGVVNHSLSATAGDEAAFEDIYDYFMANQGSGKPCALSLNYLPLHTKESVSEVIGKVYVSNTAATSEAIAICLYFAIDYGKYSGDWTWADKLKDFLGQMLGETLTSAYLAELKKNVNVCNTVIELELDTGTKKFGTGRAGFVDVVACLKSVSSLQNKIDAKSGYSTRGQVSFTITGREIIKALVKDNYLKNRRVTRKDGFVAPGFAYTDYATTFTGLITEWTRKGDELTITAQDELYEADTKLPEEFDTSETAYEAGAHYIDYRNWNPVDVMLDLLDRLGIDGNYIDTTRFLTERDLWLSNWKVSRVLADPQEANTLLSELQTETNSFIVHDGTKITFKVFAPAVPSEAVEEWTEDQHILGGLAQKSGYKDNFYNRVVVYFDHDGEGGDDSGSFESGVIAGDAASQDAAQWDEMSTKTIYSKWLKSLTWAQPTNVTGVVITHASASNGVGTGSLFYDQSAQTLQWTAPSGTIGEAVDISEIGAYMLYDTDKTKYIRVLVTELLALSGTDETDSIALTALNGRTYASALAAKILSRYKNPAATVSFEVDINNVAYNSELLKPTDLKDLTTDEAFEKGEDTWAKERVMITSVRPDYANQKVSIEAIESKMYLRYGFIAPAGYQDYGSATAEQKKRAFIGNATNGKVNAGAEDGYSIW